MGAETGTRTLPNAFILAGARAPRVCEIWERGVKPPNRNL